MILTITKIYGKTIKVINNIEFGDMFTEFYGNTIKKLSGKKHLLELRRWIFQMLSINDKRPRVNISITENVNNPKAAFFIFYIHQKNLVKVVRLY